MEDNEIKFCKDCKWCDVRKWDESGSDVQIIYKHAVCTNPKGDYTIKARDMVSGEMQVVEVKNQSCAGLRHHIFTELCGRTGRWFEKKE